MHMFYPTCISNHLGLYYPPELFHSKYTFYTINNYPHFCYKHPETFTILKPCYIPNIHNDPNNHTTQ